MQLKCYLHGAHNLITDLLVCPNVRLLKHVITNVFDFMSIPHKPFGKL